VIRALAIVGAIFLIAQIHRSAGGVIALQLDAARAIGPADVGMVIGIMPLASAAVQIPTGMLLDRWGVRRILPAMALLACLGTIWLACASSVLGLILARALIGVGFAAAMTSIYIVAMTWAAPRRMAMVSGIAVAVAGSAGAALGTTPLAVAFHNMGWTVTFMAAAGATLVCALLVRGFVDDAPEGTQARSPETLSDSLRALGELARHRELRRAFAMAFCFAGPFMTVGGLWAGPYLRDLYALEDTEASTVILAMVLAYNAGAMLYGFLDRLLGTRKWLVLGGAATTMATYGYLALDPTPPLPVTIILLVVGSLAGPYFIALAAHCRGFVPAARAGRTVTMMSLVGIAGIFVMQWTTGLLIGTFEGAAGENGETGYRMVFIIPVTMLALCSLLYLPIRDIHAHRHEPPD
jgi:predicted MFS family arabinose efflux permease